MGVGRQAKHRDWQSLISLGRVLVLWDHLDSEAAVTGNSYNPADFARLLKLQLYLHCKLCCCSLPTPYSAVEMPLSKMISCPAFRTCCFLSYWRSSQSCLLLFGNPHSPEASGYPSSNAGSEGVSGYLGLHFCAIHWQSNFLTLDFSVSSISHTKYSFSWLTLKCWTAQCEFFFIVFNFTSFLVGRATTSSSQTKRGMLWQGALICFFPLLRISIAVA